MPELPEVETIVRSLRQKRELPLRADQPLNERPGVIGRNISSVQLLWERTLATPAVDEFAERLRSQTIRDVQRRGKFIVIHLDEGYLLIHLRMSGDLRVEAQEEAVQPHDRLLINFKDGTRLVFNDTRKFGRVWLVHDLAEVTSTLGREPFDPQLSGADLYEKVHTSARAIKTLLLDQSILAGVGNIYSDEALFLAGIHPLTAGKEVSLEECERLLEAVRAVLNEGIARNGASIDWVYRGGDFQNYFKVYQRTGEACAKCGTRIERLVIGQRSSHFCPQCQPKQKN